MWLESRGRRTQYRYDIENDKKRKKRESKKDKSDDNLKERESKTRRESNTDTRDDLNDELDNNIYITLYFIIKLARLRQSRGCTESIRFTVYNETTWTKVY